MILMSSYERARERESERARTQANKKARNLHLPHECRRECGSRLAVPASARFAVPASARFAVPHAPCPRRDACQRRRAAISPCLVGRGAKRACGAITRAAADLAKGLPGSSGPHVFFGGCVGGAQRAAHCCAQRPQRVCTSADAVVAQVLKQWLHNC